ncbi:MAG: glycosyl hydrolase family 18 protein [Bacillota bacterium]
MKRKHILLAVALVLVLAACFGCAAAKKPMLFKRPGVSGFYVNDPGGFDSLPSLKLHSDVLNEIYPLWYHVNPDGSLKEEPNAEAISIALNNGIKILPLINVVPSQDNVLVNPSAMDNAINNIERVVRANNYDGVNIDFEFVPTTGHKDFSVDRDKLTQFIKKLDEKMKAMGKETHMCVLPHVGVTPEMSGVYDYGGLAPFLKKVTIMCYDHSQEGSPPGPLAPFSWVEQNITTAIKQGFKPSQICLGVATYGYDWPAKQPNGFSVPTKEIMREAAQKGYNIKWSDKYQEPYYTYTDKYGATREVWFENASTLQTKMDLVKKYKLAGICIWRLGFEDKAFWDQIIKNWGKK